MIEDIVWISSGGFIQHFFVVQTTRSILRGQVIWITPLHPEKGKQRSTLDILSTYIIKTVLLGDLNQEKTAPDRQKQHLI